MFENQKRRGLKMSVEDEFDINDEIISAKSLVEKIENPPKIAVATFSQKVIEMMIEKLNPEIIGYAHDGEDIPIYKVNVDGVEIGVFRTLIGSAGTTTVLEEVHAMGFDKFLYYGSCGVLEKRIEADNFIIPTEAYRDEGVSFHYVPRSDYITVETAPKLKSVFDNMGIPYTLGKTWTTDAIYRETKNNVEARKAEGCVCVEMECAAIMSVAKFRGFEAYQFVFAADNLDSTEWEKRILGSVEIDRKLELLEIALKIAKELIA